MSSKDAQTNSGSNTDHIYVALRVRPLLKHEVDRDETEVITIAPIKKSYYPSRSLNETSHIIQNLSSSLASPVVLSKQSDEPRNPSLRQTQFNQQESGKKKEKNNKLKGGAHYAAQVHLSLLGRKQKMHLQTPTLDLLKGSETTSELFAFDAVLGPDATQSDVFDLLQLYTYCDVAMLEGKAAAVLCYGQTGSGKSFTMSGPLATANDNHCVNPEMKKDRLQQDQDMEGKKTVLIEETGVAYQSVIYIAQCLKKLKQSMRSDSGPRLVARASYIELYQERIYDLLQGRRELKCRWSAERRTFYVEDLLQVECRKKEDFLLVLREGQSRRQQASHMLNATSSRSHALFTINFETNTGHSPAEDAYRNSYIRYGKLTLVDLAGSERLKDTGNVANDDTKAINLSLFALTNVIKALSSTQPVNVGASSNKKNPSPPLNKETGPAGRKNDSNDLLPFQNGKNNLSMGSFVPYRSSVLTKLLMDSLEGNSRTLFIICVTPSSRFVEESLRTLHFAQRVRQIRSVAVERVDSQVKERRDLLRTISHLKAENTILRTALGIPSDSKELLDEELVKQQVKELIASHASVVWGQHLTTENASNRPPLARYSQACQTSFSSGHMMLCHENTELQKMQCRDNKPNINEMGDTDDSHLLVSNSPKLPQLVSPVQFSRPFSSPLHREFSKKERCDEIITRCTPTPRQGFNALEILKNLPDTKSALFDKSQQLVAPTQHLNPAYEENPQKERIATSTNGIQKYGFRPQQRL
ncbi:unnamed protein product [Phytomonas sp. Hart1]|nr:unnamed protein product [Phytomonas sp. Hart1]|eukprot:CCW71241.1 unnamed protein product [Phytomonas sp. isolate Hart1]